MDLTKIKKVYMIGIKGVGMTMLAQFLAGRGVKVVGSDVEEKFMTDKALSSSKIKVKTPFSAANLESDVDLIIYSTAYNIDNNPEIKRALKIGVKLLSYPEALAAVFNSFYGIGVIGSHGKTTTTAWLGYVMQAAGLSPAVMAGAFVPQFDALSLVGHSDYLVAELDEYQNKLKYFQPRAAILNNVDYDHPDYFPDRVSYEQVFLDFIKKIPRQGFLVVNFDDPFIRRTAAVNCRGRIISYGIGEVANYVAYNIKTQAGRQYFKVKLGFGEADDNNDGDENFKNKDLGDFSIRLPGRHNIYNALGVIAASLELGIELFAVRKHLAEFIGTARRLEILGEFRGAIIIDDYAHHPTEIKASLAAVRELYPQKFLRLVFHPHTFTRTKALLEDFATSFNAADEVIILDIYGSAREKHGRIKSSDLVAEIKKKSNHTNKKQTVRYIPTLDECTYYLKENVGRGEVVLLMGAGDVFRIGEKLVN